MTSDAAIWISPTPYADEQSACAYLRGIDVASARAESRVRLGLPLERMSGEDIELHEQTEAVP